MEVTTHVTYEIVRNCGKKRCRTLLPPRAAPLLLGLRSSMYICLPANCMGEAYNNSA
jgi:hypothetical protein